MNEIVVFVFAAVTASQDNISFFGIGPKIMASATANDRKKLFSAIISSKAAIKDKRGLAETFSVKPHVNKVS